MTWVDVGKRIAEGASAIVPIGAGAKQHGMHMTMATDQILIGVVCRAALRKNECTRLANN